MASNINGLYKNITESFSGDSLSDQLLAVDGKTDGSKFYPADKDSSLAVILSTIDRSQWNKLSFPYTFSVIDRYNPDNRDTGFSDFELPLAPAEMVISEAPSTSIKATQGGTVVTHSGNRYKTLSIKGTTGIAPFKGLSGVDEITGRAILQPNDLKHKSGYEVFLLLRNYFRSYYEVKKIRPDESRGYRLVFKNYKDGEFYIVELLEFNTNQSASRPFMYDYDLKFRVISHFTFATKDDDSFLAKLDNALNLASSKINLALGTMNRVQEILRQIESTYNQSILEPLRRINLTIKAAKAILPVAKDISKRIKTNTLNQTKTIAILKEINKLQEEGAVTGDIDPAVARVSLPQNIESAVATQGVDALDILGEAETVLDLDIYPQETITAFEDTVEEETQLPRSFYVDTLEQLQKTKQDLEDYMNLGSSEYNNLFDRTSTQVVDPTKVATDDEFDLLAAINDSITSILAVMANGDFFKSSYADKLDSVIRYFDDSLGVQALPASRSHILTSTDTLERLAIRYLGSSSRWVEIVEANNLKYPYINYDTTIDLDGTIKVGKSIKIPKSVESGFSDVPRTRDLPITEGLSEVERNIGVDFKLTDTYDLSLTNSNDFDLIAGTDNMAQAVLLKLFYEEGELLNSPEIGVNLNVGQKVDNIFEYRNRLVRSLLLDPRITTITDLAVRLVTDTAYITFKVIIKDVDIPIEISTALPRGL